MMVWSVVHHMALRIAPSHHAPPGVAPGTAHAVAVATAALLVRAPAYAVYTFLERLPNHALITGDGLRLEGVAADGMGALISMRGPLGIRRTARTRVTDRHPPHAFGGTAEVGRRTVAHVRWTIESLRPPGSAEAGDLAVRAGRVAAPGGRVLGTCSLVTLTATILRAGPGDRLLLALGGRRWLARSFGRAISLLGKAVEAEHASCSITAL